MRKTAAFLFTTMVLVQPMGSKLFSDASEPINTPDNTLQTSAQAQESIPKPVEKKASIPFSAFTGKVVKNKVRMRIQPNLDSPILRELNKDDLLIVVGETDDFYAVVPSKDIKAYVFRTFVLDNVIEGSKVNVRLEPDLEAPVIAQLNSGDKVDGSVSPLNSKWLQIALPESVYFYVAKDYVEKIGDVSMMATMEKRLEEVNSLLNSTSMIALKEMEKPFDQIQLDGIVSNFNKIINQYPEFPEQAARAKETLSQIQESYTQKKIAYLEMKAKSSDAVLQEKTSQLTTKIQTQQNRLNQLEQKINTTSPSTNSDGAISSSDSPSTENTINSKMSAWMPVEQAIYDSWAAENNNQSMDIFYETQGKEALTLKGLIEPYDRAVKNKPGDFILVSQSSQLPIAYLYSTKTNLQGKIGQEVTLQAISRPNNNFAFPAYFVISAE